MADFTERRWPGRAPPIDEDDYPPAWREYTMRRDAMLLDARERLVERGATFMRLTYKPAVGEFIMEGWREQPADQGPEPL